MTMVVSYRGVAIAAADQRWNFGLIDRGQQLSNEWHEDAGFKLRRLDHGWCAATGSARWAALGLRALERSGVDDAEAALMAAHNEAMRPGGIDYLSRFMLAHDSGSLTIVSNEPGATQHVAAPSSPTKLLARISWPPGVPDDGGDIRRAFVERIAPASSVTGIVGAVGQAFADAHEAGGEMSDTIELGLTTRADGRRGYWTGRAAAAGDGNLRFCAPPRVPPFPMLDCEQRLFPRFEANHA